MQIKNRILALIPARAGSKRIPNKNITMLCGKPLLRWTVEFCVSFGLFDEVVISSDSDKILRMAEHWGAVPLERPAELCTSSAGDFGVIKHAIKKFKDYDTIAYMRPTTPFRDKVIVEKAIKTFSEDSLRSIEKMSESAFKCFTIYDGLLEPIWFEGRIDVTDTPSQESEATYHPNGYIDMVKAEIVESGALWGERRGYIITPGVPEIDEPEDLEYAEWWYEKNGKNQNGGMYA